MSVSIYLKLKIYSIPFDWKSVAFPLAFLLIAQIETNIYCFVFFVYFIPRFWYILILSENQKNILKRNLMIVIVTSSHYPDDERIYQKQICSLIKLEKTFYILLGRMQI